MSMKWVKLCRKQKKIKNLVSGKKKKISEKRFRMTQEKPFSQTHVNRCKCCQKLFLATKLATMSSLQHFRCFEAFSAKIIKKNHVLCQKVPVLEKRFKISQKILFSLTSVKLVNCCKKTLWIIKNKKKDHYD